MAARDPRASLSKLRKLSAQLPQPNPAPTRSLSRPTPRTGSPSAKRIARKTPEEYRAILDKLRKLLARRETLATCSTELGVPLSTLHDMARRHDLPRRRRSLPVEVRRNLELLVRQGDKSITEIALELQLAKSTVCDERRRQLDSGLTFRPRKKREPVRCPKHGLVYLWPCIACTAEAAKACPTAIPPSTPGTS